MDFRRALLRVGNEIGPRDLEKLKFACSDQVADAKRERIHTATDLFVALEEKGLLSPEKLEYLSRKLYDVGKPTLMKNFEMFGIALPEGKTFRVENESSTERLNKLLLQISDKLTCYELDRLAFAWCRTVLHTTPDQIHSAYQLFTLMSQRMAISPDNLDMLFIELSEMGRQDLCKSIQDYYAKNGMKDVLYQYPPRPGSTGSAASPSTATTPSLSPSSAPSENGNHHYLGFPPPDTNSPPSTNTSSEFTSIDNTKVAHGHSKHLTTPMHYPDRSSERRNELEEVNDKHQIRSLQTALQQKNAEIEKLYSEVLNHNVCQMERLTLSEPVLPLSEYYPMACHPHGYCVVFNNYEFYQVENAHEVLLSRGGAEIDQDMLAQTFKYLQYNVEVYENLSSYDMVAKMKEISSRNHSNFDSFICCILTHGEEGKIFGSDSLPVNLQDLTGLMKGTYCSTLVDKPKMFFIQACRGEKEDKGVPIEKDGDSSLPVEADYLFGYATPSGKAAYRSRRHGSWFISELCSVFRNQAHIMGLGTMMRKINRSVSEAYTREGYKQCTEVVDRLRREVKFLPHYPPNSQPVQ